MKLSSFIEILLHIFLIGGVFPYLISSDNGELFWFGVASVATYVYVMMNRALKKIK